jgi:hypothetical protein
VEGGTGAGGWPQCGHGPSAATSLRHDGQAMLTARPRSAGRWSSVSSVLSMGDDTVPTVPAFTARLRQPVGGAGRRGTADVQRMIIGRRLLEE